MASESVEQKAQENFEQLVNRMALRDMKTAHYESELGSLRIGIGRDSSGIIAGIFKWSFPEVDQDGKSFHYACPYRGHEGDTFEQAHSEILDYAESFAREMLSGRVTKS